MSNSNAIQVLDLSQLSMVTGGADGQPGFFQRTLANGGEQLGRWGANQLPQPLRTPAQFVLPPAGRYVGGEVGRRIDNAIPNVLPRLGGGN